MQFQTRTKRQVLTDIARKLEQLTPDHPDRPTLSRMVEGLRAELQNSPPKKLSQ